MICKELMGDDVMFISYDVSKPPPLSNSQRRSGAIDTEPACVGVRCCFKIVWTILNMIYLSRWPLRHKGRKCWLQLIINIKMGDMRRLLDWRIWCRRCYSVMLIRIMVGVCLFIYLFIIYLLLQFVGNLPSRYFIYRDGVSDGEFAMVNCLNKIS
jgi:hypothetical protein